MMNSLGSVLLMQERVASGVLLVATGVVCHGQVHQHGFRKPVSHIHCETLGMWRCAGVHQLSKIKPR